ncbi:lysozyme family protein [Peribacillus sp. SCS-155]|uniref:lysozyme family protein n=1 Tax=Peribacillus sedimenti TaxID=3115297 RepID=UPI003905D3AF
MKFTFKKKIYRFIAFLLLFLVGYPSLHILITNKATENRLVEYEPTVANELKKYGLDELTPVLLAIMDQESHGKGNDPMQSSESAGLKRNSITNPNKSIKQGVYHFSQMYKYGTKMKVDLNTIIQSYNMGPGYIHFVAHNGYRHSEKLAKSYSKSQVEKSPSLYTCGNDIRNFRYPYCFGDFSYAQKVNEKLSNIKTALR